ncbi:hypothetical protein [Paenibacillus sp. 1001270B_150601_E10]|uniref:hypothetical protein n=1 Tax=Paenibacillus sp. 1001270B_150601_E10 TaxID=2787079 RepID=UPI00189D9B4F|nr:hypothetical protein [Paenibacillus sp. 1001270B_150601_E10]
MNGTELHVAELLRWYQQEELEQWDREGAFRQFDPTLLDKAPSSREQLARNFEKVRSFIWFN